MDPEKYRIAWQPHSDHLKSMMKGLMMSEDFADVTLVTEDKKHIKAHRNIISSWSPFFREIFQKDRNSNMIIFLKGLQFSELESIMQYIYLGEATVFKERIDEFLTVAKSLEIKELCGAGSETMTMVDPKEIHSSCDSETSNEKSEESNLVSSHIAEQTQIKEAVRYECEICLKSYSAPWVLKAHKQSVHEGIKYKCEQCEFQGSSQSHLTNHIQSKHEGITYSCDQCDFQATTKQGVTKHIQSKHEGVKYDCNQCDFQATQQGNLTSHIKAIHEGVKYACDRCDYQAATKSNLKRHIMSKHEGAKYACSQCDFIASWSTDLSTHKRKVHN